MAPEVEGSAGVLHWYHVPAEAGNLSARPRRPPVQDSLTHQYLEESYRKKVRYVQPVSTRLASEREVGESKVAEGLYQTRC